MDAASAAASSLTHAHHQQDWHGAHAACAALGLVPSENLVYPARRFMLELLSDADTSASTITTLGRWLINGRRWRSILEIGAWHGATTCGLFQQKSFRIDE